MEMIEKEFEEAPDGETFLSVGASQPHLALAAVFNVIGITKSLETERAWVCFLLMARSSD